MTLLLLLLACGSPAPLDQPHPPPEWPMTNGEGVDGSVVSAQKAAKAKADAQHLLEDAQDTPTDVPSPEPGAAGSDSPAEPTAPTAELPAGD